MKDYIEFLSTLVQDRNVVFGCDTLAFTEGYAVISGFSERYHTIREPSADPDKDQYIFSLEAQLVGNDQLQDCLLASIAFEISDDQFDVLRNTLSGLSQFLMPDYRTFEFRIACPHIFRRYIDCFSSERTQPLFQLAKSIHVPMKESGWVTYRQSSRFSQYRRCKSED